MHLQPILIFPKVNLKWSILPSLFRMGSLHVFNSYLCNLPLKCTRYLYNAAFFTDLNKILLNFFQCSFFILMSPGFHLRIGLQIPNRPVRRQFPGTGLAFVKWRVVEIKTFCYSASMWISCRLNFGPSVPNWLHPCRKQPGSLSMIGEAPNPLL